MTLSPSKDIFVKGAHARYLSEANGDKSAIEKLLKLDKWMIDDIPKNDKK